MSDDAGSPDEQASFDDPDWVEKMLARALDSADDEADPAEDETPTPPADTVPESRSEPASETAQAPAPVAEPEPELELEPEPVEPPLAQDEPEVPITPAEPPAPEPAPAESGAPAKDPFEPGEADDAAWSSWASGGDPPAAAAAAGADAPTAGALTDWTQDQTAIVPPVPAAAGTAVMVEPQYDDHVPEPPRHKSRLRSFAEWGAVVVGAIVIALLVKTFLFQAFYIPSGSMEPTLSKNDRVLVNKLSYDLHDVNRGDIVVFKRPPEEQGNIEDLIKRVIALPGETITFSEGMVFVDNREVSESYVLEQNSTDAFVENIPNCEGSTAFGCTVPDGRVFVMGDNRRDSRDSRFFGPIEESSIVGRAFLKIWPITGIGFL